MGVEIGIIINFHPSRIVGMEIMRHKVLNDPRSVQAIDITDLFVCNGEDSALYGFLFPQKRGIIHF